MSAERIDAEKKVINNNQIKVKMKKNIMKAAFVAAFAMVSVYIYTQNSDSSFIVNQTLADVESTAACESVGWWDNNGNCVKNDNGVYFCKSDSWPALTDCLQ